MLKELQLMVTELNTTNSTNEKKDILGKYPQCKELLKFAYDPYIQFYVTSANVEKNKSLVAKACHPDIISLLLALSTREITGHAAIEAINAFVKDNLEYKDLIYTIIDKNLKTRTDVKLINSVFSDLIPTFEVALANKYEDQADKIDFKKDKWFSSHKLDGVRCLSVGSALFSREGKEFITLDKIKQDLVKLGMSDKVVFDGEVCVVDDNGDEHFDGIMKEIRRKDHVINKPRYKIFDILDKEDFAKQVSKELFSARVEKLLKVKEKIRELGLKTLDIVEQIPIENVDHLNKMSNEAEEKGWEGLIIRKDAPYKGKRSNDLLKVKKMQDAEYVVQGIETGPFRIISKETGLEVEEQTLSRVNILHKGNIVGVGSGFNLEQRRLYFSHPEKIVGKTITVKYFEETQNQDGSFSLRFPIVKHIYENGRDV